MSDLTAWLRGLATEGGKGVVNNIDARALGRVADELEHLEAVVRAADVIRGQWWWRQWGRPPSGSRRDAIDAYDQARRALDGEKV